MPSRPSTVPFANGETPKCLSQVIPDATHSTSLSLHMFPRSFLFVHLYFFGAKPGHRIKHRVRPYLIISTTLKAHLDICCMSHPMGYVSNNLNLYFSAVNCVILHRLVVHGQSQWLIVTGMPSKLSMPVSALSQSRALRSGTPFVVMSFIYLV